MTGIVHLSLQTLENNRSITPTFKDVRTPFPEDCQNQTFGFDLTLEKMKRLTTYLELLHRTHIYHNAEEIQKLPQEFIDLYHLSECLNERYSLDPLESMLGSPLNTPAFKHCGPHFFSLMKDVGIHRSKMLEHFLWILNDDKRDYSHENIKNILNQLAVKDRTLCSQIPNIIYCDNLSNRYAEEKETLKKNVETANAKAARLREELQKAHQIKGGLNKAFEDEKKKVARLEKDLNATLTEFERGRQDAHGTATRLREELQNANQTETGLRKELQEALEIANKLRQDLEGGNEKVARLEKDLNATLTELDQGRQDANQTVIAMTEELRNANGNVVRLEKQLEETYEIVIGLSKQLEDESARVFELEKDLNQTVSELESDLGDANAAVITLQRQVIDLSSNHTDIRSRNVTEMTDQKEERKTILVAGIHFDPNKWGVYLGIVSAFSIAFCALGAILTMILRKEKSPLVNQGESEEESSDSEEGLESEQTELVELKSVEVQEDNGQCDSSPLKRVGNGPYRPDKTYRNRPIGIGLRA